MENKKLREHLIAMLAKPNAHSIFDDIISGFPKQHYGTSVNGQTHSAWQLLEHLRLCQWDILEFSRDPDHVSPSFPEGYWPETTSPATDDAWDNSVAQFNNDLRQMNDLIADESNDLSARIRHGDGQTLLREALLLAKHNSYHIGQLAILKNALNKLE